MQIVEQTRDEKIAMYMRTCTKKQLVEMLVNCNEILNAMPVTYHHYGLTHPSRWEGSYVSDATNTLTNYASNSSTE